LQYKDLFHVTVSNLLRLTSPSKKTDNSVHIFVSFEMSRGVSLHAAGLGTVAIQAGFRHLLPNGLGGQELGGGADSATWGWFDP
jgi:hypothetical protein